MWNGTHIPRPCQYPERKVHWMRRLQGTCYGERLSVTTAEMFILLPQPWAHNKLCSLGKWGLSLSISPFSRMERFPSKTTCDLQTEHHGMCFRMQIATSRKMWSPKHGRQTTWLTCTVLNKVALIPCMQQSCMHGIKQNVLAVSYITVIWHFHCLFRCSMTYNFPCWTQTTSEIYARPVWWRCT